jgi:ribosomal protein S18 acetylase RimI-like enzyme
MSDYTIRKILPTEYPFLSQMLYETVYTPESEAKLDQNVLLRPEFAVYVEGFGRAGDLALVVKIEKRLVGAIWSRIFTDENTGYGFVNINTPELGIAILPEYRKLGIGLILLKQFLELLIENKYEQVSLSVDTRNYAYKFYLKNGFENVEIIDNSAKMILKL